MNFETFPNDHEDPAIAQTVHNQLIGQVAAIGTLLHNGALPSVRMKERYETSESLTVFKKILVDTQARPSERALKSKLLGVKIGIAINERIPLLGALEVWDIPLVTHALRAHHQFQRASKTTKEAISNASLDLTMPYQTIHDSMVPYLPLGVPILEGLGHVEEGLQRTMYASRQMLMTRYTAHEQTVQSFKTDLDQWDNNIPPNPQSE